MPRSIRLLPMIAIAVLAGCSSPPPPQTAAASEATDLRDTIQRPINKAKGVEDIVMKSKDNQDQKLQNEENGNASSPASQ